jgi:hypothetical protein
MMMSSSRAIPGCSLMRHGALSSAMSRSLTTRVRARRFSRLKCAGNGAFRYCKSMPGAAGPFERLRSRLRPRRVEGVRAPTDASDNSDVRGEELHAPGPTDLIFPKWQRELFKTILEEENLRSDRDGRPRTAYSLRHTYISLRLMEGANIYQIAKDCRTSVGMIEKYYAVHIKNSLDAAAINVVRSNKDVMEEEEEV